MKVHFTSDSNEWYTPKFIFDKLDKEFNFTLDPCATEFSAKCDKFYTIEDDGLTKDWIGETVFVNPPYGSALKHWVKKCYEESLKGSVVVMLIPSRTETLYWHEYVMQYSHRVLFLDQRIKFERKDKGTDSAPFPSAVVVFDNRKPKNNLEVFSIRDCSQ